MIRPASLHLGGAPYGGFDGLRELGGGFLHQTQLISLDHYANNGLGSGGTQHDPATIPKIAFSLSLAKSDADNRSTWPRPSGFLPFRAMATLLVRPP